MRDDSGIKKRTGHTIRDSAEPISFSAAPQDAVREIFARNLQSAMDQRGWNQSDLARAATLNMGGNGEVSRDNISKYINGKTLPSAAKIAAIASALGMAKQDLLPTTSIMRPAVATPPIGVQDAGEGMAWVRINQAVPWNVALKILEMLKKDDN